MSGTMKVVLRDERTLREKLAAGQRPRWPRINAKQPGFIGKVEARYTVVDCTSHERVNLFGVKQGTGISLVRRLGYTR